MFFKNCFDPTEALIVAEKYIHKYFWGEDDWFVDNYLLIFLSK